MNIAKQLRGVKAAQSVPMIFDLAKPKDRRAASIMLQRKEVKQVIDDFDEQERELYAIENPTIVFSPQFGARFAAHQKTLEKKRPRHERGRWVYFPWISTLSHVLEDAKFQKVRTARNRNL